MTIATTRTNEYTIAQIVRRAYRRAGLLNRLQVLTSEAQAEGQEELQHVCDVLEARGLMARSTEPYLLTLVAGQREYDVPSYTLALVNRAMYLPAGQGDPATAEEVIEQVSQEDYQTISDKNSQGVPSLYWHRRDTVPNKVLFYPVPHEAGKVRLQIQRLRADTNQGTKTIDFERYWLDAIVFRLASNLCFNESMQEKALQFRSMAEAEIVRCLSNAQDQAGFQLSISSSGRWSR